MFDNQITDASVYSDFSALTKLRAQSGQNDDKTLKIVAEQFESIFINMIFKGMRSAKIEGGIFESSQMEFYEDLFDKQLSSTLSNNGGVGLSEIIVRQLISDQKTPQSQASTFGHKNVSPAVHQFDNPVKDTNKIDSKESFFRVLLPIAKQVSENTGFPPEVLLAQSALETGWGKFVMNRVNGKSSYNLFGIKADNRWDGDTVISNTLEYHDGIAVKSSEKFRAYSSYSESMKDYVGFIKSNPRYQDAVRVLDNPNQYFESIQQAGYATDPNYSNKVNKILNNDILNPASAVLKMDYGRPIT